uniref:Family with sequence similarity 160 member A1b n=1 Tax=Tetraodon nigroviridis TaxID=99883 RepID=H3D100_TETNG
DPETCMIVFKNHWAQVVRILEKHEPSRSPIPADEASAVQNYVEHMLFLLMEEEAGQGLGTPGGAMGAILEFVVLEGVMERLFLWSLRRQFTEDMKLEQLRMYQMLLSQAKQPLLHHKPILRPLMMLLASCTGPGTDNSSLVEAELVFLLNQLCVAVVKDPSVLELFFHTSEDQGAANFLLFSLLIPYTHRQGSVGQQARDALLLIMSLSASDYRVAHHIIENTYFCPVLATGLSGLYSSLPARLQVYSEDWHCLDEADWQQVPALVHFLHSLDFCSAVTQVAHPSIKSQLLGYIYNGFLVPVLAPALHKLTVEEVMTTTAYLDLFLRSVHEPALLQTFLSFILMHTHDHVHILDTLVSRVNTPFQLGTVSLALFRTLIGLFCEDVMLQLVFRYLIPCMHLSRKEHGSLKQTDCCSSSAISFLRLMPSWCPGNHNTANTHLHTEHIHWPKGAGECDRSPLKTISSPSGSDLAVSDSVGYCRGSDFLMDVNYLHYLWDARQAISISCTACEHWSAPYDGTNPSPEQYRSDTPGNDTEEEDAIIVQQTKSDSICFLTISPPPPVLSPTPSSTDTASTGNQTDAKDGIRPDMQGKLNGNQLPFSGFNGNSCIIRENGETDQERSLKQEYKISDQQSIYPRTQQPPPCLVINTLPNGHPESGSPDFLASSSLPGSPFISVLLSRLENLLENTIAVNLLVTGILAQLASYPQPLLRAFLLGTAGQNQPNVRTLYQVLVSVRAQIERYVDARPDYPALVTQAWRFLLAK